MGTRDRKWGALLVLAFLLVAGCGRGPTGEVEGVVRYQGRPLAKLLVTFLPEPQGGVQGKGASGCTDENGHFLLQDRDRGPGVPVGKYRVFFEDLAIYEAPRSEDGTILRLPSPRIPSPYLDSLKSPLRHEVRPGHQTLDLDLTPSSAR
jgi:hypothetical protein